MRRIKYKYLLNFAVSYTGGGFKRLYEYAKWFDRKGGAFFIIHPNCKDLADKFKNNMFFEVMQPKYKRLFNDCDYLKSIERKTGKPDLYYSYGIPIYYRLGYVNWFHLSNVLPLITKGIPLSLFDKYVKFNLLGQKIKRNLKNADVISAESRQSLAMIPDTDIKKKILSVNGSDDELKFLKFKEHLSKDNIATVVGTHTYKALDDSYQVFKMLKKNGLKFVIIGDPINIPSHIIGQKDVVSTGVLKQHEVIKYLKKSKYYISTTYLENSFNAASEGIFFADESYISDIGPHRELLEQESYSSVLVPNLKYRVLHVRRDSLLGLNLQSWQEIIVDIIQKVEGA